MINYVTDGGPSHFKNRQNILNLTFHEVDFGVPAVWSFSATSHGKGPVDGLGAALKSTATRYLLRHGPTEPFKSPKEFYEFSKQRQVSTGNPIELLYVTSDEIESAGVIQKFWPTWRFDFSISSLFYIGSRWVFEERHTRMCSIDWRKKYPEGTYSKKVIVSELECWQGWSELPLLVQSGSLSHRIWGNSDLYSRNGWKTNSPSSHSSLSGRT